jgi:hypothetical protein
MTTTEKTPLIRMLDSLDSTILLSDGGVDWSPSNLSDALADAYRDALDEGDAESVRAATTECVLGETEDGRLTISIVGANGYLESPPLYVQKRLQDN